MLPRVNFGSAKADISSASTAVSLSPLTPESLVCRNAGASEPRRGGRFGHGCSGGGGGGGTSRCSHDVDRPLGEFAGHPLDHRGLAAATAEQQVVRAIVLEDSPYLLNGLS